MKGEERTRRARAKARARRTPNPHKVPLKTWRRWSGPARALFNEVFASMLRSPDLFAHPRAPRLLPAHWRTTAWNAAWHAAAALDGYVFAATPKTIRSAIVEYEFDARLRALVTHPPETEPGCR